VKLVYYILRIDVCRVAGTQEGGGMIVELEHDSG
jgi:hypothetical protein